MSETSLCDCDTVTLVVVAVPQSLSRHSLEERLGLVPDRCKRSTDVAQLLHLAFYGETSVLIRHRLKEFPDSNCGFASFAILLRSFTILCFEVIVAVDNAAA